MHPHFYKFLLSYYCKEDIERLAIDRNYKITNVDFVSLRKNQIRPTPRLLRVICHHKISYNNFLFGKNEIWNNYQQKCNELYENFVSYYLNQYDLPILK
jgi:hypothetical protein